MINTVMDNTKSCIMCGKQLKRKTNKLSGRIESLREFERRITCGKKQNKFGQWVWGSCLRKERSDKRNPNYIGKMPKCRDCKKKLLYYDTYKKDETRCKKCWHIYAIKNNFYKNKNKKNIKYTKCQVMDMREKECCNKHLADGMCNKHYQRKIYRKTYFYLYTFRDDGKIQEFEK